MKTEILKNILDFIETNEGKKLPKKWFDFVEKLKFLERLESGIPFTKDELNIKGQLDLSGSQIKSLPKGLKVMGNLNLFGCKELVKLPEGLYVRGLLNLTHTNLEELPKGLNVRGVLILTHTPLEEFSDEDLRRMISPGVIKRAIFR